MTLVQIGNYDRRLEQSELEDHAKDDSTAALIDWRCNKSFKLPESEIRQIVDSDQPVTSATQIVDKYFEAHVGHEKLLINQFMMQLRKAAPQLQKSWDDEAADLKKLKDEGRDVVRDGERDGRTLEQKLNEKLLWVAAVILWLIGLSAYCYWLHEEAGAGWGESITTGLVYALPLAVAIHILLHLFAGKKLFYYMLSLVVFAGFLLLAMSAGLFNWDMFGKTILHNDAGWNDSSVSTTTTGDGLKQVMVTLRLIGEAIIAGALSAISSNIKVKSRKFDRVEESQDWKKDKKEATEAEKAVAYNQSRINHSQRLIQKINDARNSHIAAGEALWNDLFEKKIQ